MNDVVLSLGGKTSLELGLRTFRKSQRPVLPGTVDTTVSIPGMHGAYDFGANLRPRPIELECAFITRNAHELQQRISEFAAHLLDGDGRPRTMTLIFSLTPDRYFMVRYSGNLPIERISGLGTFTLPLVAYDPFSYQTDLMTEISWDSPISMDRTDIFMDDAYSFSVTGPGAAAVNNFGQLNAQPVIEISGSFTTITITVNGRTLSYNEPLTSGVLVIDTKMMTARIGPDNKLYAVSGQWPVLTKGINTVQIGGSELDCTVAFPFRAKYL